MRMLVLGAGLQGTACAYDLLQNPDVTEVRLADLRIEQLPEFLAPFTAAGAGRPRLIPTPLDVRDREAMCALMRQCDAVMSAIPYYFNLDLARAAVDCGVHFCDLGGNTDIVFQQKALHDEAAAKGITVVPDCGVAPGMVNILAQHGIEQLDEVRPTDATQRVELVAEAPSGVRVAQPVAQHLHRDGAVVGGHPEEDGAHAALTQPAEQPVGADGGGVGRAQRSDRHGTSPVDDVPSQANGV